MRPKLRDNRKQIRAMEANRSVIKKARTIRRVPIGTRYPEDRVLELDIVCKRLDFPDRADVIRVALDEFLARQKAAGVI